VKKFIAHFVAIVVIGFVGLALVTYGIGWYSWKNILTRVALAIVGASIYSLVKLKRRKSNG